MNSFNDDTIDDNKSGPQHSTPIKSTGQKQHRTQQHCIESVDRHGSRHASHYSNNYQMADGAMCHVDPKSGNCKLQHHQHQTHNQSSGDGTLLLEEISVIEGSLMMKPSPDRLSTSHDFDKESSIHIDHGHVESRQVYTKQAKHNMPAKFTNIMNSSDSDSQTHLNRQSNGMSQQRKDMTWAKYLSTQSSAPQKSYLTSDRSNAAPQQYHQHMYSNDYRQGPNLGNYIDTDELASKITKSVKMSVDGNSHCLDFDNVKMHGYDNLSCQNRNFNGVTSHDNIDSHSLQPGKKTAAHIEQDVIGKQRAEIHELMAELAARDRELTELVKSHQSQVQAWDQDRQRMAALQRRLHQYEEELEENDKRLKDTVSEMTRVSDQKEADADALRRTKDEIGQLSSKIDENAKYIQDIEVENRNLSKSVRELLNIRHEMEARDRETHRIIRDKDDLISKSQSTIDDLNNEIKAIKSRSDQNSERLNNLSLEAETWKKKYAQANEDINRANGEIANKDETVAKVTQQLQESLQQAIALQKALFTSCEREKCKDELLNSLRKQQKRTNQELSNLRILYDRQNKDLTLFHLSVKDDEQPRYQQRRHKSVDPCSLQHKDRDIKSARLSSEKQRPSKIPRSLSRDKRDKSVDPIKSDTQTIISSNSRNQCQLSDNPSSVNTTHQGRQSRCKTRSNNANMESKTSLASGTKRDGYSQATSINQGAKPKVKKVNPLISSAEKDLGESSDVTPASSPERPGDEGILSADSEGMCPELQRGIRPPRKNELNQGQSRKFRSSLFHDIPSSLEPNIYPSSFLKKDVVAVCNVKNDLPNAINNYKESNTMRLGECGCSYQDRLEFHEGVKNDIQDPITPLPINFEAGDNQSSYLSVKFKHDIDSPRKSQDLESAADEESTPRNKKYVPQESENCSTLSRQKVRFRNDEVKEFYSSPELAKGSKVKIHDVDNNQISEIESGRITMRDKSQAKFPENRRLSLTSSDGHLVVKKASPSKEHNKSRPGSRNVQHKMDNCPNMIRIRTQEDVYQASLVDPSFKKGTNKAIRFRDNNTQEKPVSPQCRNMSHRSNKTHKISQNELSENFSHPHNPRKPDIDIEVKKGFSDMASKINFEYNDEMNTLDNSNSDVQEQFIKSSNELESTPRYQASSAFEIDKVSPLASRVRPPCLSASCYEKNNNAFESIEDNQVLINDCEHNKDNNVNSNNNNNNFNEIEEISNPFESGVLKKQTNVSEKNSVSSNSVDDFPKEPSSDLENANCDGNFSEAQTLKPFCSTRGPSLYKQLSKIHFCEKTRRYEWNVQSNYHECSDQIDNSLVSDSTEIENRHKVVEKDMNNFQNTNISKNSDQENSEKPSFLSPKHESKSVTLPGFGLSKNQEVLVPVVKKLNFSLDDEDSQIVSNEDIIRSRFPTILSPSFKSKVNDRGRIMETDSNEIPMQSLKMSNSVSSEDLQENNVVVVHPQLSKLANVMHKSQKNTVASVALPEFCKEIINSMDDQDETGFEEGYISVRDRALTVLEKSEEVQSQTQKLLHISSAEFMSLDLRDLDASNSKNECLKKMSDKSQPILCSTSAEIESSNLVNKKSEQPHEQSSFFLELPDDSLMSNSLLGGNFPMSPATKLQRLLKESQKMILCLESSSSTSKINKIKD